jgi:hypothetical protein
VKKVFLIGVALGAFCALEQVPAQEAIKPVNVEKINTRADEDDPLVTVDGLRLLYASNAEGSWDIFYAERSSVAKPWPA